MEHIGGNSIVIKEININLIRKTLREKGQATKQQLAELTGLSLVTVGSVLQQLIKENEVCEAELSSSSGGRPAQNFKYNDYFSLILIIFPYEVNGDISIHCAVVSLLGKSVHEVDEKVEGIDLESFERIISPLISTYPTIKAIGFGLPSVEMDGKIIISDYQALMGVSIAAHFSERYHMTVIMENDVNAAVVGFAKRKTIATGCTMAYLYFPDQYPPGSGIFLNGQLHKGKGNFAGEIAALPLGIKWNQELYRSFDRVCEAIAQVVVTLSCVLNPHYIVLSGSYLSDSHVKAIIQMCSTKLPQNIVPDIFLSENFTSDYQRGIIEQTLAVLEPEIALTRKLI
ncbi:ROK family transcriptional regulator [Cellulosilyticum sp. I15G10I2]|uniref:ROK family transcriptional regulator n=1 Tax=Cellulosilyticum sp. I15G10I2 TaxID=1892843 RepID=UPI00085BB743|nr:ROK family protein [Cellulosilyticum sp. I15G10I2]